MKYKPRLWMRSLTFSYVGTIEEWKDEWSREDEGLRVRARKLNPNKRLDIQTG